MSQSPEHSSQLADDEGSVGSSPPQLIDSAIAPRTDLWTTAPRQQEEEQPQQQQGQQQQQQQQPPVSRGSDTYALAKLSVQDAEAQDSEGRPSSRTRSATLARAMAQQQRDPEAAPTPAPVPAPRAPGVDNSGGCDDLHGQPPNVERKGCQSAAFTVERAIGLVNWAHMHRRAVVASEALCADDFNSEANDGVLLLLGLQVQAGEPRLTRFALEYLRADDSIVDPPVAATNATEGQWHMRYGHYFSVLNTSVNRLCAVTVCWAASVDFQTKIRGVRIHVKPDHVLLRLEDEDFDRPFLICEDKPVDNSGTFGSIGQLVGQMCAHARSRDESPREPGVAGPAVFGVLHTAYQARFLVLYAPAGAWSQKQARFDTPAALLHVGELIDRRTAQGRELYRANYLACLFEVFRPADDPMSLLQPERRQDPNAAALVTTPLPPVDFESLRWDANACAYAELDAEFFQVKKEQAPEPESTESSEHGLDLYRPANGRPIRVGSRNRKSPAKPPLRSAVKRHPREGSRKSTIAFAEPLEAPPAPTATEASGWISWLTIKLQLQDALNKRFDSNRANDDDHNALGDMNDDDDDDDDNDNEKDDKDDNEEFVPWRRTAAGAWRRRRR